MPYGTGSNNYQAGDYYQGDYYQGDPGILGSLFKGIAGAAKGLVTGGPLGAITGGIAGLTKRPSTAVVPFAAQPPILQPQLPVQPGFGVQTGGMHIGFFGPPTKEGQVGFGGGALPLPRGHYNRSTYVTRGGGTSRWPSGLQLHPKGTTVVGSRRMNVGNARALKRAIRRAKGFERLARSVMHIGRTYKRKATKRKR